MTLCTGHGDSPWKGLLRDSLDRQGTGLEDVGTKKEDILPDGVVSL